MEAIRARRSRGARARGVVGVARDRGATAHRARGGGGGGGGASPPRAAGATGDVAIVADADARAGSALSAQVLAVSERQAAAHRASLTRARRTAKLARAP